MNTSIKYIILVWALAFCACTNQEPVVAHYTFSENEKYLGTIKWENRIHPPKYKKQTGLTMPMLGLNGVSFSISKSLQKQLTKELSYFQELINDDSKNNLRVEIKLVDNTYGLEKELLQDYQLNELYVIDFKPSKVELQAYSIQGLSNGLASLYYELVYNRIESPKRIVDWPDVKERYLQIELKAMDPEVVIYNLERAWIGHFNGILFCMHNSVQLNSLSPYVDDWAMSRTDFQEIVRECRALKFEVVPQFSFLSHQKKEFIDIDISPELMFNELTLNPEKEEVYELIYRVIDEVDSLIKPTAIHIGHDEVMGYLEKQREKYGPMLPAKLFLKNVLSIHQYLASKGIETWMWSDMLLNPKTFPDMHSSSLNAPKSYEELIDSIPDDIVICDWHYLHTKWRYLKPLKFPSINYFKSHGHRVMGATWIENKVIEQYSGSLHREMGGENSAMIATVWHELLNGSTFRIKSNDSLKTFDGIVQNSAEAFWNIKF